MYRRKKNHQQHTTIQIKRSGKKIVIWRTNKSFIHRHRAAFLRIVGDTSLMREGNPPACQNYYYSKKNLIEPLTFRKHGIFCFPWVAEVVSLKGKTVSLDFTLFLPLCIKTWSNPKVSVHFPLCAMRAKQRRKNRVNSKDFFSLLWYRIECLQRIPLRAGFIFSCVQHTVFPPFLWPFAIFPYMP